MSLTLRQVRYFIATAEIGQISQAAIHLNISQSAVTTAIKELEAMLGVQLFVRSAQGMNLTDAGRHFLNRAYVIVRSVDDALNSPLPDYRASGVLRVAASYTVLGTDGFGRSDTRAALRDFFEVDRHHIVLAALTALVEQGTLEVRVCQEAIARYGLQTERDASWVG